MQSGGKKGASVSLSKNITTKFDTTKAKSLDVKSKKNVPVVAKPHNAAKNLQSKKRQSLKRPISSDDSEISSDSDSIDKTTSTKAASKNQLKELNVSLDKKSKFKVFNFFIYLNL